MPTGKRCITANPGKEASRPLGPWSRYGFIILSLIALPWSFPLWAADSPVAATAELASPVEPRRFAAVHFAYDSISLSAKARRELDEVARFLQANLGFGLTVVGNTDERGSAEYLLALGERMAREVASYLRGRGIAAERLKTLSYGKDRPVDPRHTEAARAKNRRVELSVQASDR